jgi:purine-binding chemotaxis protein CheW
MSQIANQSVSQAPGQASASQASASQAINIAGSTAARSAAKRAEFISFSIGDDHYGVDIMAVREIKRWLDITNLPQHPDYVRGVLNLRGVIIPIIDLRCRFGQGRTETTPQHIVIIVQIGERQVGLIGDRVIDIVSVDASQIQPVPRTALHETTDFLAGLVTHDEVIIALIDLPHLVAERDDDDAGGAADESNPAVPMQGD